MLGAIGHTAKLASCGVQDIYMPRAEASECFYHFEFIDMMMLRGTDAWY